MWDEGEEWEVACPSGGNPETYGVAPLQVFVRNYNQAPDIDPNSNGALQELINIEPWIVLEDVDTVISFDYNDWAENNLFLDTDDCVFDSLSSSCGEYLNEEFSINIIDGDHFSSSGDTLLLEENYHGDLTVLFQINDMNEDKKKATFQQTFNSYSRSLAAAAVKGCGVVATSEGKAGNSGYQMAVLMK